MEQSPFSGMEFMGRESATRQSRWRGNVLRCLHFLTCRICDPPPEVSDTARLALAFGTFIASAVLLTAVLQSWALSVAYCGLGLARVLPTRLSSLAAIMAFLLLASLVVRCLCPLSWEVFASVGLVALSELCWVGSLRKVLDGEFDVFVSILFLFLGVELTFGFCPLFMHWGPLMVDSKEVHQAVRAVAQHAARAAGQHSDTGHEQPAPGVGPGSAQESEHAGAFLVLSRVLPLVLLLVGVPTLSFVALIYCWMFEHMSRMVQAVTLTFVLWMVFYGCLSLLNVPVSHDTIGKAILGTVCVVMYHAFSQLTCIDWHAARMRLCCVTGVFLVVFLLDQAIPSGDHFCPPLLFGVMVACKLAYSTWANFLEEGDDGPFCAKHLLPFWPVPRMAVERINRDATPEPSAVDNAPLAQTYI